MSVADDDDIERCEVEWERPKSKLCNPHQCDLLKGHKGPHVCDCGWQRRRMRRDEPEMVAQIDATLRESNNAATWMRDRCVAKVESITDSYKEQAEHSNDDGKRRLAWMVNAAETIATELQSLTLEGE